MIFEPATMLICFLMSALASFVKYTDLASSIKLDPKSELRS